MARGIDRVYLSALLLGCLLWAGRGAWSVPAVPDPVGTPSPDDRSANAVRVKADKMLYEAPKKLLHLDGNVQFLLKDTTANSASAEFNADTEVGKLTGGVRVLQPGTSITADHMLIVYAKRRAVMTGGVRLITEGKGGPAGTVQAAPARGPSGKGTVTTITSDEMEFFWEQREGNAIGNVVIIQQDKRATADVAHYSDAAQTVTLRGNVQFNRGKGDWLRAPEAIFNMKDQTFIAQGGVFATIHVEQDKTAGTRPPARPSATERVVEPTLQPLLSEPLPQDLPEDLKVPTPAAVPPPLPTPSPTGPYPRGR